MRMMIAMAVAVTGKVGGRESRQEPGAISIVYMR